MVLTLLQWHRVTFQTAQVLQDAKPVIHHAESAIRRINIIIVTCAILDTTNKHSFGGGVISVGRSILAHHLAVPRVHSWIWYHELVSLVVVTA